jgi:ABC-type multidrug transport system ATPase subunit
VLDEPTSGLDPRGREHLWELILALRESRGLTLVVISHSMGELARVCDRLAVVADGKVLRTGTPREIFADSAMLHAHGLGVPEITELFQQLQPAGAPVLSVAEAVAALSAPGAEEDRR